MKARLGMTKGGLKGILGLALVLSLGLPILLPSLFSEDPMREISLPSARQVQAPAADGDSDPTLKVLSLNIAHGRSDAWHQLLLKTTTIEANLERIGSLLQRLSPDVVALQEADGPSFWSGGFDHVARLGELAGLPFGVGGEHVKMLGLGYGASLLSATPLTDPRSETFPLSLPTFPKGYVEAKVSMVGPDGVPKDVRVVSVHLDFASRRVRARQVGVMVEALSKVEGPLIVMGDFNGDFSVGGPPRLMAEAMDMTVFEPFGEGMGTFPSFDSRLDWILISQDLEFRSYEVIPDVVSDHLGVMAEVGWADGGFVGGD